MTTRLSAISLPNEYWQTHNTCEDQNRPIIVPKRGVKFAFLATRHISFSAPRTSLTTGLSAIAWETYAQQTHNTCEDQNRPIIVPKRGVKFAFFKIDENSKFYFSRSNWLLLVKLGNRRVLMFLYRKVSSEFLGMMGSIDKTLNPKP